MKIIDLSDLTEKQWSHGSYLWDIGSFSWHPNYIGNETEETHRLILPKFEGLHLNFTDLNHIPNLEFDEYEGGLYLAYRDNPYHFFIKPAPGAKVVKIQKSTRHAFSVYQKGCAMEELLVEAEDIVLESGFGQNCDFLRRVEFRPGKQLILGRGAFEYSKNLGTLIVGDRDRILVCQDSFRGCGGLKNGMARLPYRNVSYERECFCRSHIKAVYIDEKITEIDDCFDDDTIIFYGGDASKLRTHHVWRMIEGEWDGDPHHPTPSTYEGETTYGNERPNTYGNATPEDYENYLKTH